MPLHDWTRALPGTFYRAADLPVAHLSCTAVGRPLPPVPIYLDHGAFVDAPLEVSYTRAFEDTSESVPGRWGA